MLACLEASVETKFMVILCDYDMETKLVDAMNLTEISQSGNNYCDFKYK